MLIKICSKFRVKILRTFSRNSYFQVDGLHVRVLILVCASFNMLKGGGGIKINGENWLAGCFVDLRRHIVTWKQEISPISEIVAARYGIESQTSCSASHMHEPRAQSLQATPPLLPLKCGNGTPFPDKFYTINAGFSWKEGINISTRVLNLFQSNFLLSWSFWYISSSCYRFLCDKFHNCESFLPSFISKSRQ